MKTSNVRTPALAIAVPFAATLVAALTSVNIHGQSASPAPERAALVELFTSEGCSSCPPADDFLGKINGSRTPSGVLILALSEHVTYWDQKGWKDPYSSPVYTDRQESYQARFHLADPYTPQMVINGDLQASGSDGKAVLAAIESTAAPAGLSAHIVSAAISGGHVELRYAVIGVEQKSGQKVDIFAVVAADAAGSKVSKGENAGHVLAHTAVARSINRIATVRGATEEKTVQLPLKNIPPSPSLHLVLFAQAAGAGHVLSVETAPLN